MIGSGLKKFAQQHGMKIARGVAYGTASHVIGTTRAMEESELSGAVSSLSLTLAGLITSVILSWVLA